MTRSKKTVRPKLIRRTRLSVLEEVFSRRTKPSRWLMLYATIKRIAAMVGMGIKLARGIKNSSTSSSTTECTIPAMGVLPPLLMFAAVRAIAPVAGIPPKNTEAMLPRPCATSSALGLWRESIIVSATTQERSDSMAAKMAMVKASGKTASILPVLKSMAAKSTLGKPAGIS